MVFKCEKGMYTFVINGVEYIYNIMGKFLEKRKFTYAHGYYKECDLVSVIFVPATCQVEVCTSINNVFKKFDIKLDYTDFILQLAKFPKIRASLSANERIGNVVYTHNIIVFEKGVLQESMFDVIRR